MTFATVAASGTPKATPPQDVRPARSILRPLPEGDAFSDHAAPGRHRLESMTSTSSSGSELVGTEAANFSGYVRQSAARHYPTGLGPVRLVHVCRDEDQREVVLVAGDCAEEQPAHLRPAAARGGRPLVSSLRTAGQALAGAAGEKADSPAQQSRSALLRTSSGAFVVDSSPGSSVLPQYTPVRPTSASASASVSASASGSGLISTPRMSGLSALRASGWSNASAQSETSLPVLSQQVGHLQVWEAALM